MASIPPTVLVAAREILEGELQDKFAEEHRATILSLVADEAADRIDPTTGRPDGNWVQLDDPGYISNSVLVGDRIQCRLTDRIMRWRSELDAAMVGRGYRPQSRRAVETLLAMLIPERLSVRAAIDRQSNLFPDAWPFLADALAARLDQRLRSGAVAEWEIHHRLLLVSFFQACRLCRAQQVLNALASLRSGPLGLRGHLLRIPETIDAKVVDAPPDLVRIPRHRPLAHGHLTDLLRAADQAAGEFGTGRGVLHRHLPLREVEGIPLPLAGRVSPAMVREVRLEMFKRYEAVVVAYISVIAVEQLLRAWAQHVGLTHIDGTRARPIPVHEWLDALGLSASVKSFVRSVYAPDRGNIRNRLLHGGLLEIEGKRLEATLVSPRVGRLMGPPPDVNGDRYAPSNIAAICLACLYEVDQAASAIGLTRLDFSWIGQLALTAAEVQFGHDVHCDLIAGRPRDAIAYSNDIRAYFHRMLPCLGRFIDIGLLGFIGPHVPGDSLFKFLFGSYVFEAAFRMTAGLRGNRVLRQPSTQSPWRFSYRVLEQGSGQLASAAVVDELLDFVSPSDRHLAVRIVELALKTRNAVSHGAIDSFDHFIQLGNGHILVKASQALRESGLQHMTREAAYFRSLRRTTASPPDMDGDWYAAEDEVYHRMHKSANSHEPPRS